MAIINKQIVTLDENKNENVIHVETSASITKMIGFSSLSYLSGLIEDTDSALQALKKLQSNIQNIKVFTGTDGNSAGLSGLVPAPNINDDNKFLKSNGTWSGLESESVNSANQANKLSNPVNLQTNLSSNSVTPFDGSSDVSIGISGILPIANGGTNATTAKDARKSIFGDEMVSTNSKYFITINEDYSTGGYLSIVNAKSVLEINNIDNTADSDKTVAKANALTNSINLVTDLTSSGTVPFNGTQNTAIGILGVLPVTNGGTGESSLANIKAGKDSDGNPINSTYAKLSGATFTGDVKSNSKFIGNLEGNASTANRFIADVSVITNLASSNSAILNGTSDIAPGITGVLSVSNGGTGQTSLDEVLVGKANELSISRNIDGILFNGTSSINHFVECTTESGNVNKTVECPNFVLEKGSRITILFTITNTANNPTLNVNSTGAKPVYYRGFPIPASVLQANSLYDLIYNGNQWLIVGSVLWTE